MCVVEWIESSIEALLVVKPDPKRTKQSKRSQDLYNKMLSNHDLKPTQRRLSSALISLLSYKNKGT